MLLLTIDQSEIQFKQKLLIIKIVQNKLKYETEYDNKKELAD